MYVVFLKKIISFFKMKIENRVLYVNQVYFDEISIEGYIVFKEYMNNLLEVIYVSCNNF